MNDRIVILGGRLYIPLLAAACEAGIRVVLVRSPGAPRHRTPYLCEKVIEIDPKDLKAVAAAVIEEHQSSRFSRVISMAEECLVSAAELNEILGLPGNTKESVSLLKNKALMREKLAAWGVSPVAARVVNSSREAVRFMSEVGGPIILKPVSGAGSWNVVRASSTVEIEQAWPAISAAGPVLAEEFLFGYEISVESFSYKGSHEIIAMTEKTLKDFVEVGHAMPAALDQKSAADAEALVQRFLDVVGLDEGPCHTEVMLTPSGPRIIESQNRVGGGGVRNLLEISCDLDFARLTATVPLGLDPAPKKPTTVRGAAIRFLRAEPGIVTAVEGVEEVRQVAGTTLFEPPKPGDVVPRLASSWDRVNGYVIGEGADVFEAVRRCELVTGMIKISTEAG